MSIHGQTSKLKERLGRWQVYAAEPTAPTSGPTRPDTSSACPESDTVSAEATPFLLSRRGDTGSHFDAPYREATDAYAQQIAQLESELEHERAQAQEMKTRLALEVTRQRQARREQSAPQAVASAPLTWIRRRFQNISPPDDAHALSSWAVIGISLLIAGLCSLLAIVLEHGWTGN